MRRGWVGAVVLAVACVVEPADDGGASSESGSGSSGASASSGGAESSTADSGESGAAPIDLDCLDPQPRLQYDGVTPSGFVACSDGFVHRVEAVTCIIPETGDCEMCPTDCSDAPNGRCMMDVNEESCSCVYSCETDAECGDGSVCACIAGITGIPRCVPASCTTTDDCGGGLCGISGPLECGFQDQITCLDESSECRTSMCDFELESEQCLCYSSSFEYECHNECFNHCA